VRLREARGHFLLPISLSPERENLLVISGRDKEPGLKRDTRDAFARCRLPPMMADDAPARQISRDSRFQLPRDLQWRDQPCRKRVRVGERAVSGSRGGNYFLSRDIGCPATVRVPRELSRQRTDVIVVLTRLDFRDVIIARRRGRGRGRGKGEKGSCHTREATERPASPRCRERVAVNNAEVLSPRP